MTPLTTSLENGEQQEQPHHARALEEWSESLSTIIRESFTLLLTAHTFNNGSQDNHRSLYPVG